MLPNALKSYRMYPGTTPEREAFLIQKLREASGCEMSTRTFAINEMARECEVQQQLIANPHLTRREAELITFRDRLGDDLFEKVYGRFGEIEAARVAERQRRTNSTADA